MALRPFLLKVSGPSVQIRMAGFLDSRPKALSNEGKSPLAWVCHDYSRGLDSYQQRGVRSKMFSGAAVSDTLPQMHHYMKLVSTSNRPQPDIGSYSGFDTQLRVFYIVRKSVYTYVYMYMYECTCIYRI